MSGDSSLSYMNTRPFETEVRQLLDIVIHAFYSDREVFIRELASNGSDALEKLRLKQLTEHAIYQPERDLRLSITTDEEAKTLTISDSGIGMTEEEIIEFLGTIAHSGTKKYLEKLKESQGTSTQDLIGQFGVGFYSVFMVAHEVEVISRSWQPDAKAVKWTSDGREGYSLEEAPADTDRGTSILIKLNEEAADFSKAEMVRGIVQRYSNFIGFPIDFNGEHLNTVQAIWLKNKKDVTPEEYQSFYQFIAHTDRESMTHMHFNAEAPIAIASVLYVPDENPESMGFGRTEPQVSLYCHKVLIDSKPEGLLPEWLRFLAGVVDSEDLPLNISREMLQDNTLLRKISGIITSRFIKHLEALANEGGEPYEKFYAQFSRFLKEGVVTSWEHKESLGKLLRFESTFTEAGKMTSFGDYIARMKENQKDIYVLYGASRAQLESSPYLDALAERGFEVAFFTEGGDQFVIDSLMRVGEKEIKSIDRANLDLPEIADAQDDVAGLSDEEAQGLTEWVNSRFPEQFDKVTTSDRARAVPAIALQSANGLSPEVRAYLQAMGQSVPESKAEIALNPKNPIVMKLAELRQSDEELAGLLAGQIVDTALLRAGMLENTAQLAENSQALLEKLLNR